MNQCALNIDIRIRPELDPGFLPAAVWKRAFDQACEEAGGNEQIAIALQRPDGTTFVKHTPVLPHNYITEPINNKHVERLVKRMLWLYGGSQIVIAGSEKIAEHIRKVYSPSGDRAFDYNTIGSRIYLDTMTVRSCAIEDIPDQYDGEIELGRNLNGCRIGFDLGGSDRKAAAIIDGNVVFSEEIEWDPYFESDPNYHFEGIQDSLKRAAEHLPRVDAIGGSAAGVYVANEPRIASLFRGVSEDDFDSNVRNIFHRIQKIWDDVPFEVANDGEVTALAGSMSLNANAVLGIALGTSEAAGYCNSDGRITSWLNELAFVPVDYRDDAPADEWSGDIGCGVQYFSQQAVVRLAPAAGIDLPADMPFPDQLKEVQKLMTDGDERARKIFLTIGTYLGYAIMTYAEDYTIQHLLLLGRVTSGEGGSIMIDQALKVLEIEAPELAEQVTFSTPDEKLKRHGQAIAAASLPKL